MSKAITKPATVPEGSVRMKYTGKNVGAITRTNPDTKTSYRLGNNVSDRYQFIPQEDLAWAQSLGVFEEAPLEETAPAPDANQTLAASTGEQLPAQPPEIKADANQDKLPESTGDDDYWANNAGLVLSDATVQALKDAGLTTLAEAQALTDEELDAIPGVGPVTIQKIREAK